MGKIKVLANSENVPSFFCPYSWWNTYTFIPFLITGRDHPQLLSASKKKKIKKKRGSWSPAHLQKPVGDHQVIRPVLFKPKPIHLHRWTPSSPSSISGDSGSCSPPVPNPVTSCLPETKTYPSTKFPQRKEQYFWRFKHNTLVQQREASSNIWYTFAISLFLFLGHEIKQLLCSTRFLGGIIPPYNSPGYESGLRGSHAVHSCPLYSDFPSPQALLELHFRFRFHLPSPPFKFCLWSDC